LAPWDGRHEHRLAASFLTVALTPGDSTRRMALLLQGRAAEERAIKIEPRNGLFYAGYGQILFQLAKFHAPGVQAADVKNAFTRAVERDPANPDIMNTGAQDLLSLGQYQEASALALRCAQLYPELADPIATLGLSALRENRYAGAADTLELSLKRDWAGDVPDKARALTNLSGAYLGLHRFEQARAAAEEALKIDPSLEAAVKNRAVAVQWLAIKAAPPK
jgi:tetratricopeptide (TPR) repeat protein